MIIARIIPTIVVIAICLGIFAQVMELCRKSNNCHKPYGLYERFIKRFLDVFLSTGALLVLSPILLVLATLVRIKLGSPILFIQNRPGKDEKIFRLYKFRSMTDVRDKNGVLLSDDERLTAFGRKLRSTSLDELPELLNVVKGDMALLGPRPLLVEYLPYYTCAEKHRHDVRPGLSGLAQIHGRNAISWEEKFAWDIKYVNKITFMVDLKIIFDTIIKTIKRSDILVGKDHMSGRLDVIRRG